MSVMHIAERDRLQSPRQIRLGLFLFATGYHPAGWRLADACADGAEDPGFLHRVAQTVEHGRFDFFFLGDALATSVDMQHRYPSQMVRLEPFTMMGSIAAATWAIGLVVTANTTYSEPYHVARMLASLDHLSGGRIAWNVVTGADARAAQNFGQPRHAETERRYDRAEEFITTVQRLWDSWEDGALPRDRATGCFADAAKVHPIDHRGSCFAVAGPLNVPRPPQGNPPIVQAGTSERARDLGARFADIVFTAQTRIPEARAFRDDLHARARPCGRDLGSPIVMPGLVPIVGQTLDDAQCIYDKLNSLVVNPDQDLGPLSQMIGVDLTRCTAGDPLPALTAPGREYVVLAEESIGRSVQTVGALRDFFIASGRGHRLVLGDGRRVADFMEEWLHAGAADGFNICPPYLPGGLELFVDLVVPELQQRGLLRWEYEGTTFRELLDLSRPAGAFAVA
jgi:FMN-dependent oxidoreductase (nitrilotriacetate monooxygenase family)